MREADVIKKQVSVLIWFTSDYKKGEDSDERNVVLIQFLVVYTCRYLRFNANDFLLQA